MTNLSLNRAEEINRLHSQVIGQAKMTLQTAIRIGELLTEQKSECAHGEWLPWLEANMKFSRKQAQNYMNCYDHRERLNDTPGIISIAELARVGNGDKPRGAHKAPQEHVSAPVVIGLSDQGLNSTQIADRTGVSKRQIRHIVEEENIRREASAQVSPQMLSMSARDKLNAAIRQEMKKLAGNFQVKVNEEINRRWAIASEELRVEREEHKRVMNARNGFMTKATYKKILACLHPDWVTDEKQKARYEDAFREFKKLEKCILNEKESPTSWAPPLPRTVAEWEAAERKATAERKAKRATTASQAISK